MLLFGGAENEDMIRSIPFKTKAMGQIRDEHTMALLYNAADLFCQSGKCVRDWDDQWNK